MTLGLSRFVRKPSRNDRVAATRDRAIAAGAVSPDPRAAVRSD